MTSDQISQIRAALENVRLALVAREETKRVLADQDAEVEAAVRALHDLTGGTPITVEGHRLVTVVGGGKSKDAAFLRGANEWLGFDRPTTSKAKPREAISL